MGVSPWAWVSNSNKDLFDVIIIIIVIIADSLSESLHLHNVLIVVINVLYKKNLIRIN